MSTPEPTPEQHSPRRWILPVIAGVVAVALVVTAAVILGRDASRPAGSASPGAASGAAASAAPQPSVSPDRKAQLEAWAGGVCVARDRVGTALVAFGSDLTLDPTSDVPLEDQFNQQLAPHLDDINAAIEQLGTAVGSVPMDYAEVAAAVAEFESKRTALQDGGQQVLDQLKAAQEAPDLLTGGAALVQAGIAAKETYEIGAELVRELDALTKDSRGEIGEAFRAAPACR